MKTCLPWLLEQIDLVRPAVMVALGATAVEGLLGKGEGITRLRGRFQTFRGIPVMPTFHPSYLLHNSGGDGEAQGVGGHDAGAGKTRRADQRKAARVLSQGIEEIAFAGAADC